MIKSIFCFLGLSFVLFSCSHSHEHKHGHANKHMNQNDFEDLVKRFESKERDEYQKPQEVLNYLGDIKGKKIMEIGAGTGYFSFRMVEAGAKLIAADVDERFQKYIQAKKEKLNISDEKLSLRKVPYDSPNLTDGEVDMALIVNTYHHIEQRAVYFAKVKKGLSKGGSLVVIDFFKKKLPIGPPLEMKISATQVQKELAEAGFSDFTVEQDLLSYQYIITAK